MTINSPKQEKADIIDKIIDAKNKILSHLHARIAKLENALQGERPDPEGNYSEDYYKNKDKREQLNIFISVVLRNSDFESLEAFIQSICQEIQNFPDESYENLFRFITEEFRVEIHPMAGPPIFYKSWLNHWAKKCGVTPEEIEKVMPLEKFQEFEQQNDTAARIKIVLNKFKKGN